MNARACAVCLLIVACLLLIWRTTCYKFQSCFPPFLIDAVPVRFSLSWSFPSPDSLPTLFSPSVTQMPTFFIFPSLISAWIHFDWWIDVAYWHEVFPCLPVLCVCVIEKACAGDTCFDAANALMQMWGASPSAGLLWCLGRLHRCWWGGARLVVSGGWGRWYVERDGWETM